MIRNRDGTVISVFGQRGTGKSSFVRSALPGLPRFIAWDAKGTDFNGLGYMEFNEIQALYRYLEDRAEPGRVFRAVYTSLGKDETEDLEKVCMIVNALEDVTLIVEEIDQYSSPYQCPFQLKRVIKLGRSRGISAICISQRPAEIPRLVTSQSERFICFGMTEPSDIRYLRAIIGQEAEDLQRLEKFHYIEWHKGKVKRGIVSLDRSQAEPENL